MKQLIYFILLILPLSSQAEHIIGGLISYEVQTVNLTEKTSELLITCQMFRDPLSAGANFDDPVLFGIYEASNTSNTPIQTIQTNLQSTQTATNGSVELEIGLYQFIVTLEHGKDYITAYQRCCRSPVLNNIEGENVGMALQLEIFSPALESIHQSPVLSETPKIFQALGFNFSYNLPFSYSSELAVTLEPSEIYVAGGTTDANINGGMLGCCDCLRPTPSGCPGPFENAVFGNGYSFENPFGNVNDIAIDEMGTIAGVFNISGRYQYGIQIETSQNNNLYSRQVLDCYMATSPGSAVSELSTLDINISPNPCSDIIQINNPPGYQLSYELLDLSGRSLQKGPVTDNTIAIDLDTGVYTLLLTEKDRTAYTKLVVSR